MEAVIISAQEKVQRRPLAFFVGKFDDKGGLLPLEGPESFPKAAIVINVVVNSITPYRRVATEGVDTAVAAPNEDGLVVGNSLADKLGQPVIG